MDPSGRDQPTRSHSTQFNVGTRRSADNRIPPQRTRPTGSRPSYFRRKRIVDGRRRRRRRRCVRRRPTAAVTQQMARRSPSVSDRPLRRHFRRYFRPATPPTMRSTSYTWRGGGGRRWLMALNRTCRWCREDRTSREDGTPCTEKTAWTKSVSWL